MKGKTMKKYILGTIAAATMAVAGTAMAQDVDHYEAPVSNFKLFDNSTLDRNKENGFFVGFDYSRIEANDNTISLWGFNGGYKHYLTDKVSAEVFLSKGYEARESADLTSYGIGIGYDMAWSESLVVRPNISLERTTIKTDMFGKEKTANIFAGLEFKPTKSNVSYNVGLEKREFKDSNDSTFGLRAGIRYHF